MEVCSLSKSFSKEVRNGPSASKATTDLSRGDSIQEDMKEEEEEKEEDTRENKKKEDNMDEYDEERDLQTQEEYDNQFTQPRLGKDCSVFVFEFHMIFMSMLFNTSSILLLSHMM